MKMWNNTEPIIALTGRFLSTCEAAVYRYSSFMVLQFAFIPRDSALI